MSKKDKHIEAAQKFLLKNQLPKAIKEYQKALDLDPKDMRCRQRLAEILNRAKMVDEAIGEFQIVAKYYSENGFYLKAIAVFKQIQKLVPNNPDTYLKLAELNTKQGLTGNALAEYRSLVAFYEKENKVKETTEVLQKMKALEPDNLNVRFKITENLAKLEKIQEAKQEIEELRKFLEKKQEYPKLLKLFESSRALFAGDQQMQIEYGRALALTGQKDAAREVLNQQFEQGVEEQGLLLILASGYRAAEGFAKEQEVLQQFLTSDENNLDVRQVLIDAFIRGGAWDDAFTELENWKEPLYRDGRGIFIKERYERLQEEMPGQEDLLLALRWIYERTGDGAKLLEVEDSLGGGVSLSPVATTPDEEVPLEGLLGSGDIENLEEQEFPVADIETVDQPVDQPLELADEEPEETPEVSGESSSLDLELELDLDFDEEPPPLDAGEEEEPLVELELPDEPLDLDGLLLNQDGEGDTALVEDDAAEALLASEEIEPLPEDLGADVPSSEDVPSQVDFSAELDEAQFYLKHGLYNDAETVCQRLLTVDPTFKPAVLLLQELDAKRLGKADTPAPKSDFFDLGEELRHEDGEDSSETEDDSESGLLDGIFSEFKKGVDDQIGKEDAESHYNLGIAYKEMGLLDDAIAEFEKAIIHPDRTVDCLTLKGICLSETGKLAEAEEVFLKTLQMSELSPEEQTSLHYELGLVAEKAKRPMDALQQFQTVADTDSFFRDVGEKIRQLRNELGLDGEGGETPSGSKNRVSYL